MAGHDTGWIQTYTGRPFWPLDPRAEDVCIEDIAHALSMKCRYSGHCRQFYSVAQHSVLLSREVHSSNALWALLHDATEAYLPDVPRPVKPKLAGFAEIEACVEAAIAEHFGLTLPIPAEVKHWDTVILGQEKRDLMLTTMSWGTVDDLPPMKPITGWYPHFAKQVFLARFEELTK